MKVLFRLTFFASAIIIAGCASVPKEKAAVRATVLPSKIPFRISIEQQRNRLVLTLGAHSPTYPFDLLGEEYARSNDAELTLTDQQGAVLHHAVTSLIASWDEKKTPGGVDADLAAVFRWNVPDSMLISFNGNAHIQARNKKHELILDTTVVYQFDSTLCSPLRLIMHVDQNSSKSFSFNMAVYRLREADKSYLPTTLTHDWMVLNEAGEIVWQQSYGQMYGQMLTPVAPQGVGEQMFYTDGWDGMGNIILGSVLPGRYRLVGIIPSRPLSIVDTTEFIVK